MSWSIKIKAVRQEEDIDLTAIYTLTEANFETIAEELFGQSQNGAKLEVTLVDEL